MIAGGTVRLVRQAGLVAILLAVGKLFIVDLTTVDAVWRMLLFAGFGLALLAIGYWLDRPNAQAQPEDPPEPDRSEELITEPIAARGASRPGQ